MTMKLWGKRTLYTGKCKVVQSENRTPYDLAMSLLGIYLRTISYHRDIFECVPIAALVIKSRKWNWLSFPSASGWIKTVKHIYTVGFYSAVKWNYENFIKIYGIWKILLERKWLGIRNIRTTDYLSYKDARL